MAKKFKKRVDENVTIESAFNEFIFEKESVGLSTRTIDSYKQSVRLFYEYHKINELSRIEVSDFYRWIKHLKDKNVKIATINHYLRDNRCFFYWCMDAGYINQFSIKLLRGQEEPVKFYTDDEIERLLVKPDKKAPFGEWRNYMLVNWILATGNRISTVAEVKLSDIDFKAKEITLRYTKNNKIQIIPLSNSLEVAIQEYIKIWSINEYLFPKVTDEKMDGDGLRKSFAKYAKKRNVNKHSVHGLRHTFARLWVKNNGSVFILQKMLGHSTLDMTRKYVKLFSDDIKEDYELYSPLDILNKKKSRKYKIKKL